MSCLHLIPNDNNVDLTPPRLSLAANNTHYTGDWGHGPARGRRHQPALDCDFTPARNVMWADTFVLNFKLFQIWGEASAIISREWFLGKEAIWVETLGCWESRPKEMSLSRRENCQHQAQNIRQDAETQQTDWWYFATNDYPQQLTK